jgi:hypothetical protein
MTPIKTAAIAMSTQRKTGRPLFATGGWAASMGRAMDFIGAFGEQSNRDPVSLRDKSKLRISPNKGVIR